MPEAKLPHDNGELPRKATEKASHQEAFDGITFEAMKTKTHTTEATGIITAIVARITQTGQIPLRLATADIAMVLKAAPESTNPNDFRPVAM